MLKAHSLDILVLITIASGIIYGYKKGILRIVISLIGFAAAAALGVFVSSVCSEYVYIRAVRPAVISALEKRIEDVSVEYGPAGRLGELFPDGEIQFGEDAEDFLLTEEEFRGKINSVFAEYCGRLTDSLSGVLPDEIAESAGKYLEETGISAEEKLDMLMNADVSAAELLEENVIRPVMIKTVKNVIFAVVFIIVIIAFSVISRIAGILRKIELVKAPDSFLGGIAGFVYGLLLTAALSLFCGIYLSLSSGGGEIINTDVISGTFLFKYAFIGTFAAVSALL